ncbi:hypothetical protein F7725_002734 [Dissostichus mawsoni]|uniref:Zinc finger CCHC domain-containing protein n=1 Tax=Dissostichus mawsoni TaxID=36200 RepID=A0A7J5Y879_DISMA|nr:hypothetical protein F7725_002734 [Dissostichus mawsoni]
MGFWTGRRQFQVLLKSEPEGVGGLKHPPASFSLGGDRGYLFYPRQPAFCRGAGNQATWREGALAPAAGFVAKGVMKLNTALCPRPAMAAVGPITSTVAVLGVGGRPSGRYAYGEHGETATVEQGPGGGPGTDSVSQGLAGNKDSPVGGEVGVKPGARKGSQAFGTEVSADNGDSTQVGDSKRPKTEGMRRKFTVSTLKLTPNSNILNLIKDNTKRWMNRNMDILKEHYNDLLHDLSLNLPPFRRDAYNRAINWARQRYHSKLTRSSISAWHSLLHTSDPHPPTYPSS